MNHLRRRSTDAARLILLAAVLAAGGCAGYRLQGAVVEGATPGVFVVNADDHRLTEPGLPGAVVRATVDPHAMKPKRLGATSADPLGRFEIPVREVGAGFLEYEVEIVARATGHQATVETLPMPTAKRRLLIVLAPGRDTYQPPGDIVEESLRADPWKNSQ